MTAQQADIAVDSSKILRQPISASSASAGNVAVTDPHAPSMIIKPFRIGTRSLGNQMTRAFNPAVNAAATPKPITARPATSNQKLSAAANIAAPTATTPNNELWMRLGPYRSNKIPIG